MEEMKLRHEKEGMALTTIWRRHLVFCFVGNTKVIHAHPHCRDDSVSAGEVKCMEISCALRRLVCPQF